MYETGAAGGSGGGLVQPREDLVVVVIVIVVVVVVLVMVVVTVIVIVVEIEIEIDIEIVIVIVEDLVVGEDPEDALLEDHL